jgi:hypothetical protein
MNAFLGVSLLSLISLDFDAILNGNKLRIFEGDFVLGIRETLYLIFL